MILTIIVERELNQMGTVAWHKRDGQKLPSLLELEFIKDAGGSRGLFSMVAEVEVSTLTVNTLLNYNKLNSLIEIPRDEGNESFLNILNKILI